MRRGRISERRLIAGGDESISDPSRVPPGKGLFHGISFAPYDLAQGGPQRWDEIKEEIGDLNLAAYRHFVPNLTAENIIARKVYSPLDLERSSPNSMVGGDVHGVAPFFYQTVSHRPTSDLGQYTVPGVDRLYLVGPFMHPGGGVYGAGRATAMKMFRGLEVELRPGRRCTRMKIYGAWKRQAEMMTVSSRERDGSNLVIKGTIFGTMPLAARLRPEEARKAFGLLNFKLVLFLLTLPFRKGG